MRDDVVLQHLIAEGLHQDVVRVSDGESGRKLLQQLIRLIGEVFVVCEIIASLIADIRQRSESCQLLVELVSISQVDERFEEAKGDCYQELVFV